MLRDHLGPISDRLAGMFIGAGLFQDIRGRNIWDVAGAIRE